MPRLVFRSSFPYIWKWTTTFTALLGVPFLLMTFAAAGLAPALVAFPIAVILGLFLAIAVYCFPVYVQPDGLRCYNFWGHYRLLPWERISRVRKSVVFGLQYLVASEPSGANEVWVPLYLSDMPSFVHAVEAFLGGEHELVIALRQHSRDT